MTSWEILYPDGTWVTGDDADDARAPEASCLAEGTARTGDKNISEGVRASDSIMAITQTQELQPVCSDLSYLLHTLLLFHRRVFGWMNQRRLDCDHNQ